MIKYIFFCLFFFQLNAYERVVLHFDINKTLIASDLAGQKSMENVINHLLAEKTVGIWEEEQEEPISYYDYVHTVITPGKPQCACCKKKRKAYLDRFVLFLEETDHPLKESVKEQYDKAISALSSAESEVFPSFFRLVADLQEKQIPFSIVLRSFGHEIREVAAEIERISGLHFDEYTTFTKGTVNGHRSPVEIHDFLTSGKNLAIQDDWAYWHSHGEEKKYGKPFYYDPEDEETLSLFFDDNDVVAPLHARTGASLPPSHVIQVDTLEAILNVEYFLHFLQSYLPASVE